MYIHTHMHIIYKSNIMNSTLRTQTLISLLRTELEWTGIENTKKYILERRSDLKCVDLMRSYS